MRRQFLIKTFSPRVLQAAPYFYVLVPKLPVKFNVQKQTSTFSNESEYSKTKVRSSSHDQNCFS